MFEPFCNIWYEKWQGGTLSASVHLIFLRFQSWVPSKGCSAEDHSISRSSGTAAACASAAIPHANGDPNSALNPFQKEVYQESSAGHSISEQKSTKCQSLYRSFISITIPTKKWCNLRGGGKLKLTKRFPLKPKLWKFKGVGEPRSGAQASSVGIRCPLLKAVPTSAGVASPQQHKIPGADRLGKTNFGMPLTDTSILRGSNIWGSNSSPLLLTCIRMAHLVSLRVSIFLRLASKSRPGHAGRELPLMEFHPWLDE